MRDGYRRHMLRWMLALAALAITPLAFAQSVSIGGTSFNLGASRADTFMIATTQFRVVSAQSNDQYNLYPKHVPGARQGVYPPAIGSITFADNRLVRVTRNLGTFRCPNGKAAIQNLIAAFAQAPNAGRTPTIHTDNSLSGNASLSRVYFSYPDRAIQIAIYKPADQSEQATIDITEQYALAGSAQPVPSARPGSQ